MSAKHISLIYFYLVSIIALIILTFGVYHSITLTLNLTQFEKYPLLYSNEDCEFNPLYNPKGPYPSEIAPAATPTPDELARQKIACENRVEQERKQRRLDDIRNAATFSVVGLLLFLTHFSLARKNSKS